MSTAPHTPGRTVMPIMGSLLMSEIPWAMIAPHERQAQSNHGQSLERLAQRGGLAPCEALDIMAGHRWATTLPGVDADTRLINKVREWRAAIAKPTDQEGGAA